MEIGLNAKKEKFFLSKLLSVLRGDGLNSYILRSNKELLLFKINQVNYIHYNET